MPDRIVLAEDDREVRELLAETLQGAGYDVSAHASGGRALTEILAGGRADLLITDLVMPGMGGRDLLEEVLARRGEINVIVITAFGTIDSAIELVKAGAHDYLTKPFSADDLLLAVEQALEESRLRREAATSARSVDMPPGFVGTSRPMREVYRTIRKAAASNLPVLVTGETGTGKELVARALHQLSGREVFIPINCAALPEHLLESELFGHERGAFTGAEREKPGLLEAADGGTLFLDELAEFPLSLQPKLLRALEDGEVRRVGARATRRVDVRVVAATNRSLEAAVESGAFRRDLFWRLNVVAIEVPPLRERPADILPLTELFLTRRGGEAAPRPTSAAMGLLTAYAWPGNVRELRNVLEGCATLAAGPRIDVGDLPSRVREASLAGTVLANASERGVSLREVERRYIQEVLRQTAGNRSKAAEILGLDRKTLYRKLQEYEKEPTG